MSERIHVTQLAAMVSKRVEGWLNKLLFGFRSWFFDEWYYPIKITDLYRHLEVWRSVVLPNLKYRYDVWDCDDFAEFFASWFKLRTKTNCAGMALGKVVTEAGTFGHAWNIVLVRVGHGVELREIEPQLGTVIGEGTRRAMSSGIIVTKKRTAVNTKEPRYRLFAAIW